MSRLLAGELIKVRTTRTALGFGLAAVLLVLAAVLISILTSDLESVQSKVDAVNFGGGIAFVLLVFGAVGSTGEFRHRTLAPAVLIAPDRLRLVIARIAAYSLTALVFAVAMAVVAFAVGLPLLAGEPGPQPTSAEYVRVVAGGVLAVVLAAAIGVSFGTLVRNQVAAVVGILVWIMILEPLLMLLIKERASRYLLGPALGRLGEGGNDEIGFAGSLLVLVAWAVVLCAVGLVVDRRRDVD
jgi:ABC-2 type transport system permease protein